MLRGGRSGGEGRRGGAGRRCGHDRVARPRAVRARPCRERGACARRGSSGSSCADAHPLRDFQVQNARKPCRCQRITVSGRTRWRASRHPAQRRESHTQKARSRPPNRGRFERWRSRASCCWSARFSSARSVRVLRAARAAPKTASTRDIAAKGRSRRDGCLFVAPGILRFGTESQSPAAVAP